MRTTSLLCLALTLTASLASAGDLARKADPTSIRVPLRQATSEQPSAELQGSAQLVARGLALALNDKALRIQLRDSMRASQWNEHKLLLQDFARSAAGRSLTRVAAKRLSLPSADLERTIASLPALDFYMAYREHRTTWRGTPDFLVAAAFDSRAPVLVAFDRWGNPQKLKLEEGVPTSPLIILHPAEPKFDRAAEKPSSSELIEGARIAASTPPVSLKAPGYYLYHYNIQEGDGWYGGDCEMEFHTHVVFGNYSSAYLGTVTRNGVKEDIGYNVDIPLPSNYFNVTPPSGYYYQYFLLYVVESDGSTSNDHYGTREYPLVASAYTWPILEFFENTNIKIGRPWYVNGDRSAWIGLGYR